MRVVLKNEVGYKYIDVSPVKQLLFIGTYFIRQINGFSYEILTSVTITQCALIHILLRIVLLKIDFHMNRIIKNGSKNATNI